MTAAMESVRDGGMRSMNCNQMHAEQTQHPRKMWRNPASIALLLCTLCMPTSAYAFTNPQCHHGVCSARLKYNSYANKTRQQSCSISPVTLHATIAANSDSDEPDPLSDAKTSSSTSTSFIGLPSYKKLIKFVATTFLIWVSEPLLSLVDSAAVGRFAGKAIPSATGGGAPDLSSVIQLASLGPATMLCDSSIYLTLFIAMSTTNKLARAFAKEDPKEQLQTLSHAMGISIVVGTLLFLLINFQGESMLAAILGPAGATISVEGARGVMESINLTPEVLRASLGYSRIRSAVSPLAVMGLTSQAALLCAQDTKTPVIAVLIASVVNIVGDYIFVARMGWGVQGAALATSIASFMANGMLVAKLWRMTRSWKNACQEMVAKKKVIKQSTSKSEVLESTQADLSDIPFISFPDKESLVSFLKLAGPMFFVMLGKILGYSAMTVRAGNFGMVSLACHNVLMRIFFFFATVGDALSQSAQTFLPGLFYQKEENKATDIGTISTSTADTSDGSNDGNTRTLLKRLLVLSSVSGIVNCFFGRCIAQYSGKAFTSNVALVSLMSHVSPFMGLGLLLHPLTMALEGSIIASGDSGYLVGTYVAVILVLLGQLKFICKDFLGVWHGILIFQALRILQFGFRVWQRTASSKGSSDGLAYS